MTAPNPIVVTPEMRAAVYAADCVESGHLLDIRVGYGPGNDIDVLGGRPEHGDETGELHIPHLTCRRCKRVWLVVSDQPANTYEAAEDAVETRMSANDSFGKRIKDTRDKRNKKDADDKALEEAIKQWQKDHPGEPYPFPPGHEH